MKFYCDASFKYDGSPYGYCAIYSEHYKKFWKVKCSDINELELIAVRACVEYIESLVDKGFDDSTGASLSAPTYFIYTDSTYVLSNISSSIPSYISIIKISRSINIADMYIRSRLQDIHRINREKKYKK